MASNWIILVHEVKLTSKKKFFETSQDFFTPASFSALDDAIRECHKCGLPKPCVGWDPEGNLESPYMFIGEALGKTEVEQGRPFVGKSGIEFTMALNDIGLDRREIYASNVVKARPVTEDRNRTPLSKEINACISYLFVELGLLKPKVVVLLGGIASKAILGEEQITLIRGKEIVKSGMVFIPTYHPSYVMRSRSFGTFDAVHSQFISDLLKAKKVVETNLQSIIIAGKEVSPWALSTEGNAYYGQCFDYKARQLILGKQWKAVTKPVDGYRINQTLIEFSTPLEMNFILNKKLKAFMLVASKTGDSGLKGQPSIKDYLYWKGKLEVFTRMETMS